MKLIKEYNLINKLERNPFVDSQARKYSDEQTLEEFYPTSIFWSLFNPQNEIYLGTRGSGKTIMMRMASYNLLRKMKHKRAQSIVSNLDYICFFVPLNLEFATSLINDSKNNEYFLFSVNCLALEAYFETLEVVIGDIFKDEKGRIECEIDITEEIVKELNIESECVKISDLRSEIAVDSRFIFVSGPGINSVHFGLKSA